ncbi:dnaJ homolog subfamily C member 9 [Planococcus citri]|uniref:dnaJ homolog subfamily C member 9 n=1 Tax=Planococcus citri TaxID=170843 RepID=UPI0031F791E8
MTLIKLCQKFFGKKDLYEVFGITKTASDKEIRRAYHRLSLKVHPDRVSDEEKLEATEKFKVVSAIHAVLSNKSKRKTYDRTGTVDEEDDRDMENWKQYWQSIFKIVTQKDIEEYETKYKGSDEELEDLKKAYVDNKGDMDRILEYVLFSSPNDEPRFGEIINKWISDEEVPDFPKFTKEPESKKLKRKTKYEKEAKLAEKAAQKRKAEQENDEDDLVKAIQLRQSGRASQQNDFLQKLEEKYCQPEAKKTKAKSTKGAKEVPRKTCGGRSPRKLGKKN